MMKTLFVLIASIITLTCSALTLSKEALQTQLSDYISRQDARVGVAVIVEGKDTVQVNGHKDFPMMSVMKFPQALALAAYMDEQGISMGDTLDVNASDLQEDTYSPMLRKYGKIDLKLTYSEVIEWSLMESDNNACDIIFKTLGGTEAVGRRLCKSGIDTDISIEVTEADMHEDPYRSYLNRSTPIAMAALFDLYDTTLRECSANFQALAAMLEQCRTGLDRLAAPLIPLKATLGHKTGTGFDLPDGRQMAINDCGYVHLPTGQRYTIAVFVADANETDKSAASIIADISAMVSCILMSEI